MGGVEVGGGHDLHCKWKLQSACRIAMAWQVLLYKLQSTTSFGRVFIKLLKADQLTFFRNPWPILHLLSVQMFANGSTLRFIVLVASAQGTMLTA